MIRFHESEQDSGQGAFPGTALTDQGDMLTRFDLQTDVLQGRLGLARVGVGKTGNRNRREWKKGIIGAFFNI